MFLARGDISWMSLVAIVLVLVYGATISLFRKEKIIEGTWCKSDVVAYILVPIFLLLHI
jgi:hypothetical protein